MATKRRRDFQFEPLTMTWSEVADGVFYRTENWLRSNLPSDFPRPDPTYDLFAREAVETWVRRRYGIASVNEGVEDGADRLIEKLRRGKSEGPLPGRATA